MAWTVTFVSLIADTTDQQTYDSATTNTEFTSGKTYLCGVAVLDTAAFTKFGSGFAYSTNRNLSWWYYKPGSTLTNKTLRVVFDDAGTGCAAILLSVDESTTDPPIDVTNFKTATDTDADVSVTPDALQTGSLQLALELAGENATQTCTGTNWANVVGAVAGIAATPSVRSQIAANTSGTAAAVTFSSGNSLARGVYAIEVKAGASTGQPTGRRFGLSLPQNTQHGIEGVRIF
jgi:hypothetical protein